MRHLTAILTYIVMTFACSTGSAELVVNGDFETGDFTGWALDGDPSNNFVDSSFPHSGIFAASFGEIGGLGSLSQSIQTTAGLSYVLSFWFAGDGTTPSRFTASIEDEVLLDIANPPVDFEYRQYQYIFTASSSTTLLSFGFQNDTFFLGLDDVSITPTTGVPEPTSMIPLGVGIAALGGYTYGRRGKSEGFKPKAD